jgi:hypothetical protein
VQQLLPGAFAADVDDADAPDGAAAVRGALGRDLDALLLAAAQLGMRVELTVYSGGAGADAGGDAAVGAADGAAGASQQRRVVCCHALRAQDGGALRGALAAVERAQAEHEAEVRAHCCQRAQEYCVQALLRQLHLAARDDALHAACAWPNPSRCAHRRGQSCAQRRRRRPLQRERWMRAAPPPPPRERVCSRCRGTCRCFSQRRRARASARSTS